MGLLLHHALAYCPPGWLSFESSCYDFVDQYLNWPDASQTCQAMHSELVTIDNVAEYHFIHKHLVHVHAADVCRNLVSYWTSGNDIAKEGTWVWGNNEEMDFTYWWPGEPGEHRDSNCVALQSLEVFMFNDDHCNTSKNHFICEINNANNGNITGGVIVG